MGTSNWARLVGFHRTWRWVSVLPSVQIHIGTYRIAVIGGLSRLSKWTSRESVSVSGWFLLAHSWVSETLYPHFQARGRPSDRSCQAPWKAKILFAIVVEVRNHGRYQIIRGDSCSG
jgi:hypothetical protein